MRESFFIFCFVIIGFVVDTTALSDWEACLQSTQCRQAYQQYDEAGDEQTFDALMAMGMAGGVETDTRVKDLLARIAHLGSICRRNEVFVEGRCVCPDEDNACGEVTPFFNTVIYAACLFGSLAILTHIVYDIMKTRNFIASREVERHEEVGSVAEQAPLRMPVRRSARSYKRTQWG